MEKTAETATGNAPYFPAGTAEAERFDALVNELGGPDCVRPQQAMLIADIVRGEALKVKLWEAHFTSMT